VAFDEAIAFLRQDSVLGPYVARLPEPDFERTTNPLRSLVRAIVYQQLSGKAAGTIYGRMAALIGADEQMEPGHLLAVSAEDLRGAGLSQSKAAYLHNIARHFGSINSHWITWTLFPTISSAPIS
jgi:DNA-3-methyladenine glycosylase II